MTVNDTIVRARTKSAATTTNAVRWVPPSRYQRLILISVDTVIIVIAYFIAHLANNALLSAGTTPQPIVEFAATGALAALWLIMLRMRGVYGTQHLRAGIDEYRRVFNASVVAAGLFGIACFLVAYDYPRLTFGLWFLVGVLALSSARIVRRRIMRRLHVRGLFQTPVLVAGSDHHVDAVAVALRHAKWTGYKIVGAVTTEQQQVTATGLSVLGGFDDLVEIIKSQEIATVIFTEGSFTIPSDFHRLAWQLEDCRVQMMVVPTLADVSSERLDFSPIAGLPLVDVARPRAIHSLRWTKRAADVAGSLLLLLLAFPVLLTVAIAIKLEDGGPVVFRQRRVGLKGEMFNCLKFRSVYVDAEAKLAALQSRNEDTRLLFKIADDPRITRVGRFIRSFSIDELPQLLNTLRGDMSLVGPRPALPSEVALYDSDTMRRLQVRPGLACGRSRDARTSLGRTP